MNECCPTVETPVPVSPPVEWCAGNKLLRWDGKRITESARTPLIPDGVYTNPTIRTVAGCIVELTEGTNVVYSACDPCALPPTPPPPTTSVDISGEACNLSSLDGSGALITRAFILSVSPCITVNGCGTPLSPFQIGLAISPDAGNSVQCRANGVYSTNIPTTTGVNFIGCGITIQNGLVTALPTPYQPVLNLTSSDASVLLTRSVDGCSFDLVVPASGGNINFGGQGAQLTDTPLGLNNPPQNGQTMGVVGVANPRAFWIFVQGVGWREVRDSTASPLQITI